MTKIVLLVLILYNGSKEAGLTSETYDMPSIEHCEEVGHNLVEILSEHENVEVVAKCFER